MYKWNILICTIEERRKQFELLYNELSNQVFNAGFEKDIQISYIRDDKKYSIGHKRNHLLKSASKNSEFICFIDDDDWVSPDYISKIYTNLNSDIDCIGMTGIITFNGVNPKRFIHSIKYTDYSEDTIAYYRPPNHLNPIKTEIATKFKFPVVNFGEDTNWAMQIANAKVLKKETFIDEPIYYYKFIVNK